VPIFAHRATSREALAQATELRHRLGLHTSLRELIRGDYLLLYARRDEELFLLAIKRHRQLSVDMFEHWPE